MVEETIIDLDQKGIQLFSRRKIKCSDVMAGCAWPD
jgi:hypothetical protein